MRRDEEKRSVIIIVLLALVVTISVGYALMSANLLIKGTTNIVVESWDVHFTNLRNAQASSADVTVGEAANIVELTTTPSNLTDDLNVQFAVTFKKPGDKYEFDVDVTNAGSLYAKCTDITPVVPAALTNLVEITYSGIAENDILTPTGTAGATKTMHVVAKYKDSVTTLPSSAASGDLQIGIAFEQTNPTS